MTEALAADPPAPTREKIMLGTTALVTPGLGSYGERDHLAVVPDRAVVDQPASTPTTAHVAWRRRCVAVLGLGDVGVGAVAAWSAARLAPFSGTGVRPVLTSGWAPPVLGAIWVITVLIMNGYGRRSVGAGRARSGARSVLRSAQLLLVLAVLVVVIMDSVDLLRWSLPALAVLLVGGTLLRVAVAQGMRALERRGTGVREIAVVGEVGAAAELAAQLENEPSIGAKVVGVYVPRGEQAAAAELELEVLGDLRDATSIGADADQLDAVAVAPGGPADSQFVRTLAWSLEDHDVDVLVQPAVTEVAEDRIEPEPSESLPLLHIAQPSFDGWRRALKRAADLVLATLGLLVISPALLVIALVVVLDDHGPVLFSQTRIGRDGHRFTMLKFRSMIVGAERQRHRLADQNQGAGPMFKIVEDPRVTRVGRLLRRYSLDELPQLINVLTGSMSLVGPRPPLPEEVRSYSAAGERRLLVKPGMTGLWQVSGRSALSWEESLRLDLRYVENWSLGRDVMIMVRTVGAVVGGSGAY